MIAGCNYDHQQFIIDCKAILGTLGERRQVGFWIIPIYRDKLIDLSYCGNGFKLYLFISNHNRWYNLTDDIEINIIPLDIRKHILNLAVRVDEINTAYLVR